MKRWIKTSVVVFLVFGVISIITAVIITLTKGSEKKKRGRPHEGATRIHEDIATTTRQRWRGGDHNSNGQQQEWWDSEDEDSWNPGNNNDGGGNGGGGNNTAEWWSSWMMMGGRGNFSQFPPGDFCVATGGCSNPAKYVVPLPIPTVFDGTTTQNTTVTITARKACQQIFHNQDESPCGSPTEIWAYNGSWPGPTIIAQKDLPLNIRHINELGDDYEGKPIRISTHHHGLHLRPSHDGHARPDLAASSNPSFALDANAMMDNGGDSYTYEIPNHQEPGTHWYHDHTLHATSRNVIMGLAGFYLIQPNKESAYDNVQDLPVGEYEIGLAFQDRRFIATTNQMDYPMNHEELIDSRLTWAGYFGDTMLVNGVHAPFLEVKKGWYRFRLLNGCNARELDLQLTQMSRDGEMVPSVKEDDLMIYQIGTEGGFIATPTPRSNILMAPGERYDVLIDFRHFNIGDTIYFRNNNNNKMQRPLLSDSSVMQFRIIEGSTPTFILPTDLVKYSWPTNPTVTRSMRLGDANDGSRIWAIEKHTFEPNVANFQIRQGTTERWKFVGRWSNHAHPMHIHLVQFHIDGTVRGSLTDGWKDIVRVPPNGEASIVATFDGEPGIYMFHCHNIEHEDYDMMLQFEICDDSPQHPCDDGLLNTFVVGGRGNKYD